MRDIKLLPQIDFHNYLEIAVIDATDGKDKQRCKITVEYAEEDISQLQKQGKNKESIMKHFDTWIYEIIKLYISDDFRYIEGKQEVMQIIERHVDEYF